METNQKSHTIELSENFSVPVEELFKAWTEAEHLKQWWHPMGSPLDNVTNELQEGGKVEYTTKDFTVSGSYQEVQSNQKLVYTWNWQFGTDTALENEDYVLTIGFESSDNGSTLHVKQEGLRGEESAPPHEDAWKSSLKDLKSHLENASSGSGDADPAGKDNLKSDEGMNDRSGGYNEVPEQVKVGGA